MKVTCPHCDEVLVLSEKLVGKLVRCPSCEKKIRVDLEQGVHAGSPEIAQTTATPHDGKRRRRSGDVEDGDAIDHVRRRRHRDSIDERADRKALAAGMKQTRFAGQFMAAACGFTALTLMVAATLLVFLEGDDAKIVIGFSGGYFAALHTVVVGAGVIALFTLSSRKIIVSAIAMNIAFLLMLGGILAYCVLTFAARTLSPDRAMPVMVMTLISGVLNVSAAVIAWRAIRHADVLAGFEAKVNLDMREGY